MSSSSTWSDRRALFQKGKELHEPGRRPSNADNSGGVLDSVRRASVSSINSLEKTVSNTSASLTGQADSPTQRRRSSAASQGLFSNLNSMKRGHENYDERRASHDEMVGTQSVVSGWWNSTFKGMQKTATSAMPAGAQTQQKHTQRGVME